MKELIGALASARLPMKSARVTALRMSSSVQALASAFIFQQACVMRRLLFDGQLMCTKRSLFVAVSACFLGVASSGALASDAATAKTKTNDDTTTTVATPIPNGNANYLGDRLIWDRSIAAWSSIQLQNHEKPGYCLPAGLKMVGVASTFTTVTNSTPAAEPANPNAAGAKPADNATREAAQTAPDSLTSVEKYLPVVPDTDSLATANAKLDPKNLPTPGNPNLCKDLGVTDAPTITDGTGLFVSANDVGDAMRMGWDYGALIVPFKIQLGGKHAFTGSSSLGGYFGYRFPLLDTGLVFSPVIFAGATNISTSSTTNGVTTSQTLAGLSFGGGLITRVKDTGFQMGLIFGMDHVDSSQPYAYNDKIWASLEIGYSFAN